MEGWVEMREKRGDELGNHFLSCITMHPPSSCSFHPANANYHFMGLLSSSLMDWVPPFCSSLLFSHLRGTAQQASMVIVCYCSCRNWLWLSSDADGDEGVRGRHAIRIQSLPNTGGERWEASVDVGRRATWAVGCHGPNRRAADLEIGWPTFREKNFNLHRLG